MQKKYKEKYNKEKEEGSSVRDIPKVYNIQPSKLYSNPIRLIDIAGFGGTSGIKYDEKIADYIKRLFEGTLIIEITGEKSP